MSENIPVPPDLFKGLKFCLIDDGVIPENIKDLLLAGGGTHNSYLSDMVTHVICDDPENEGVSEAQELFEKPVVTSQWVILSAKSKKLLPLAGFAAEKNRLFFGMNFSASQVTVNDKKKICAMVNFFGGKFHLNFTKLCTHLVVGKPEGAKYDKALELNIKIITPDWVLDSLRNKYVCDEELYHPRLLILPEPEVPAMPSPESPAAIPLDKINIDPSIASTTPSDQAFFHNFQNIKLDNKIAEDILSNLPVSEIAKMSSGIPSYANEQTHGTNRMISLPTGAQQIPTRPLISQSSQAAYQQSLQHQQMLQQGEQKLNQALQQIQQAQQQPNLQQRIQIPTSEPQILQQKGQWQQQQTPQRMTLAQQQQIQQHILQVQRMRALQQQQQQLRNRPGLPPSQFAQLPPQQSNQQQISLQAHLQRQQGPTTVLQKQTPLNTQQITHQQGVASQNQQTLIQSQLLQSQPSNQNQQAQLQLQLQAQMRQQQLQQQLQQQQQQQQQNLSQLQLQQQALQKHQLQQQLQQQLLKQQHLQHLQQQQQAQINQQRAVTQSPNIPSSSLHLQQQGILQQSPRQSPLQQSLQHSTIQHTPQQTQIQTHAGIQIQHQQSPQRSQTPLQQTLIQQQTIPLSPLQQAALEKAQQSAVDKQQTELIKVQLKQAALERAQLLEKAKIQQALEKIQLQLAALENAQLQAGLENPPLQQQNLLQHPQLQRSAAHQLQIQQQLHKLQLQKAALLQAQQTLNSQQASAKMELSTSIQSSQMSQSGPQFIHQAQLQAASKPQLPGSVQQQISGQRLQLQQMSVQQLQQRLQLQHNSGQRLQLQGPQTTQLQQGTALSPLHVQLQLQQQASAALQQLPQGGSPSQPLQQGSSSQIQQIAQQLRMQQSSPAQQIQLQQGSPAQLSQGSPAQLQQASPAQLPQGSPAHSSMQMQSSPAHPSMQMQSSPAHSSMQMQSSPAHPSMQLQSSPAHSSMQMQSSPAHPSMQMQSSPAHPSMQMQSSPAHSSVQLQGSPSSQHSQLQQGSPAQHLQLSQGSPASNMQAQQTIQPNSSVTSSASTTQQTQLQQVPSQNQVQVSSPQISSQHSQIQVQQVSPQTTNSQIPQIVSQDSSQKVTNPTPSTSSQEVQQMQTTSLQQTLKQLPLKQAQILQAIPRVPSPHQMQTSLSSNPQETQQNQLHVQMSPQQQTHQVQSSIDINQSPIQSPIRQPSPIQMQFHPSQAQLQKLQLQRAAQQSQLQQTGQQQVLIKQISQAQLQQGISSLSQSGNQQIQLSPASMQQVHLHVLQQARLQQLRQQQAAQLQSITQVPTSNSQPTQGNTITQLNNLQQGQVLQDSHLQQLGAGQIRQTLHSSQGLQNQMLQNVSQSPRLSSPLQQAQLQQLAQLQQQAQIQKSQTVSPQNQLQTQLQQIQLRNTALQQARLQQPGQPLPQGHITRPQQSQVQGQILTKQIQLQQQPPPSQVVPSQTPPSPQMQQTRFTHQLSPALRAVQKQFPTNVTPAGQPPMHGQPPVQTLHQQQQLLQQRQQLQQQLALQQQLRQRQLQQQQQLQNAQNPPQQAVQQILTSQSPVMMKPPPQYPYDRQQLQGQPRLQYPAQPRQLSPQQQSPRGTWPQTPPQQSQFLRQSPGANPPQSPQWQQSPKEELTPSPQPTQQVIWSQRPPERDTATPVTPTQQVHWQQNQQLIQQRDPQGAQQTLQWQQLKQLELRRQQQLLQQQQQGQRPQFSPQSDTLGQTSPRITVPSPQHQTLAVPAQYQPQNAPSILSQTSPGSLGHGVQPQTQVTPKTKTALANLLNTRLQTTGRSTDGECPQVSMRSPQIIMPGQAIARRSSADGTVVLQPQAPDRPPVPVVPPVIFYGHNPKFIIPPDLCLLGCVFCIEDYDKSTNNSLEMWTKIIEKHGGEVEASYSTRCTHVICENQRNSTAQQAMREGKRCVTAYWLNDVLEKKKLKYPWLAHHLPTPFSDDKPCKNQIISITNFEAEERIALKNIIGILGAKYTGYLTSHNTIIICKTNEGRKVKKAREWRIPVVNVEWLHDLMFGHIDALRLSMAHKYQQYDLENPFAIDYALVPHLMAGWKEPIKISEELLKKHNIEIKSPEALKNAEKDPKKRESKEELQSESKRPRVESPPLEENIPLTTQNPPNNENKPRVLFTGFNKIKDLAKVVCQLGGCLAKTETECTHLVANQCARTVKFLCAIHIAKFVVTVEWISECEKQNKFVDEKEYILHDNETEKQFGFNMESLLSRTERSSLFKNYVFFITPGVYPRPDVLSRIIEAGGGISVLKKAPSLRQVKNLEQTGRKFAIISCENDLHLCKMYLTKKISVQNVEFILTGSLRQELDVVSFTYTEESL